MAETRRKWAALVAGVLTAIGLAFIFQARDASDSGTAQAVRGARPPDPPRTVSRSRLITAPLFEDGGTGAISGRVVDESGAVPGAVVLAVSRSVSADVLGALPSPCPSGSDAGLLQPSCPEGRAALVERVTERVGEPLLVARTVSGADGRFELRGLEGGEVEVSAETAERFAPAKRVNVGASGLELRLQPGGVLYGRVVDGRGDPIQGARIVGIPWETGRFFDASTSADGTFAVGPAPPGRATLVATATGYGPQIAIARTAHPQTLVLSRLASLSGQVWRGQTPVAGALVRAQIQGLALEQETSSDGRFHFADLPPGSVSLQATLGAEVGRGSVGLQGRPAWQDLQLAPGVFVEATVRYPDGRPVAGAEVVLQDVDHSLLVRGVTDARGTHRFGPVRGGRFVVQVERYEGSGPNAERIRLAEGTSGHVDLVLSPATASLSGSVRWTDGSPARRVRMELRSLSPQVGRPPPPVVVSGADGAFVFRELVPGNYELRPRPELRDPSDASTIRVPSDPVQVVLERGFEVRGRVTNVEEPGSGVTVSLSRLGERRANVGGSQVDPTGRFLFTDVPPGEWAVVARQPLSAEAARMASEVFEIRSQDVEVNLTLELDSLATLSGRVVDDEGLPIAGMPLSAHQEVPRFRSRRENARFLPPPGGNGRGRTDAQGHFQLWVANEGKYSVAHQLANGATAPPCLEDVAPGAEGLECRTRRGPMIRGIAVDPKGAPLQHFWVNDQEVRRADGAFVVDSLGAQELSLEFRAPGLRGRRERVQIPGGDDVVLGPVEIGAWRGFRVRVRDRASGEPIAGAEVRATSINGGQVATSDERGLVDLEGAGAQVHVAVRHPLYVESDLPRIRHDVTELDVLLDRGLSVKGRVVLEGGEPLRGARVQVLAQSLEGNVGPGVDGFRETTTDQWGGFVLEGMRGGRYSVTVITGFETASEAMIQAQPASFLLTTGQPPLEFTLTGRRLPSP